MPKRLTPKSATGRRTRVFAQDTAFTDGRGLAGLTYASAGVLARYHLDGASSTVAFALGTGTLGTWTSGTVGAPTAPTASQTTTGGTVAAHAYFGVATYTNAVGETVGSTQFTVTTTGATSTITVPSPAAASGATGWNCYMGTVTGGPYFIQGGTNAIGASVVLTATPATSGANPPGSNTAAWYGMAPVDGTNIPGLYEISLPDATWAGGDAVLSLRGTGFVCPPSEYQLTLADFSAAPPTSNALLTYAQSLPAVLAVGGATASAVILSGLPTGRNYVGQRLVHLPSGESRIITGQAFGSGNYTLTLGNGTGILGPFSASPATGDPHMIGP